MFVPSHSTRVFVEGEVEWSAAWATPRPLAEGQNPPVDLASCVTDLKVLDYEVRSPVV